tara:strand:+ start:619 stop:912 length:294 start_codon:yes stop_codon:yes gene_type:complete
MLRLLFKYRTGIREGSFAQRFINVRLKAVKHMKQTVAKIIRFNCPSLEKSPLNKETKAIRQKARVANGWESLLCISTLNFPKSLGFPISLTFRSNSS